MDNLRDRIAVTYAGAAFVVAVTGCMKPPPPVETSGAPPPSQTAAPSVASGDDARPKANGVKLLSGEMGARQKVSGGSVPEFPRELRVPGRTYLVPARICVSNAGVVDNVSIQTGSEPALATTVILAVKDWRYRPLTASGGPAIPFCYVAKFEFRTPTLKNSGDHPAP